MGTNQYCIISLSLITINELRSLYHYSNVMNAQKSTTKTAICGNEILFVLAWYSMIHIAPVSDS